MALKWLTCLLLLLAVAAGSAAAQDLGTLDPKPLPPLANPNDPKLPAKELFARKTEPLAGKARSIGFYSNGCIAGAVALPINGPTWQVMRLSRNRNWGHPDLIALIERLSAKAKQLAGWPGILIGDIAQPRGGPMWDGHNSHQVGLDADIWLTPMPNHELTREERELMNSTVVVAESRLDVDPQIWTPGHLAVIKAAAEEPRVERIFVNPAIKQALCRDATGDRGWLHKVRPWPGHDYHFHIRISCPSDSPDCKPQPSVPPNELGCGHDLDGWFKEAVIHPKPTKPTPTPGEAAPRAAPVPPAASLPQRGDGAVRGLASFLHRTPQGAMSLRTIEELFTMCDYSLQNVKSRPASVGDKLTTRNFGTGTRGFAAPEDPTTAVCVLPGTELAFSKEIACVSHGLLGWGSKTAVHKTAIFRQINKDIPHRHHDALEFPDGETVLLTELCEGQDATVLQLPAIPTTAEEVEKQTRVTYVG